MELSSEPSDEGLVPSQWEITGKLLHQPKLEPVGYPPEELCVLDFSGSAGPHGRHGRRGKSMTDGGLPGYHGEEGQEGVAGGCGASITIDLSGNAYTLNLDFYSHQNGQRSKEPFDRKTIRLSGGERLMIDARGGIGGDGGAGGDGGDGAVGKDGLPGKPGSRGSAGHNGGAGGRGGTGGNGGKAGDGGPGGRAGDGGHGGHITFTAADTRLFALVCAMVQGGPTGAPGSGGKAGTPGAAGRGGPGGAGGMAGTEMRDKNGKIIPTKNGTPGQPGKNGSAGTPGNPGATGALGAPGKEGSIRFIERTDDWTILHSSMQVAFQPRMQNFSVRMEPSHGIFEPGQLFVAHGFDLCNDGPLRQPAGASIELIASDYIRPMPQTLHMTSVESCRSVVSRTGHLWGRIRNPFENRIPSQPGIFQCKSTILAQVSMLERTFPAGTHGLDVNIQYPLQLASVKATPSCLSPNGEGSLSIQLRNISVMPYGCQYSSYQSSTESDRALNFDVGVVVAPRRPDLIHCTSPVAICQPSVHGSDKSQWLIRMASIEAQKSASLDIDVKISDAAEHMDQFFIDVFLRLRNSLVQLETCVVRCVKEYNPRSADATSDILLVTGSHINLREWRIWQEISAHYLLSIAVWDIERQQGISPDWSTPTPPWFGKKSSHRMIIFTFYEPHDAQYLCPAHLLSYLLGPHWAKQPFLRTPYESHSLKVDGSSDQDYPAVLFFNAPSARIATMLLSGTQEIVHYDSSKFKSFNVSVFNTSVDNEKKQNYCNEAMDLAQQFAEELSRKDTKHLYAPLYINLPAEKDRFQRLHWSFGECGIGRMPLPRDCFPIRLIVDESPESSSFFADETDARTYPSQSFLSTFSKVTSMVYWCLPFSKKLEIFIRLWNQQPSEENPSGYVSESGEKVDPWILHTQPFTDLPAELFPQTKEKFFPLTEVYLAFLEQELLHEFNFPNCYDLPLLRWMTQLLMEHFEEYEHARIPLYRLYLQLEKSTFWRIPNSLHKKKRAALLECKRVFIKLFFPEKTEATAVRKQLKEPYVHLSIVKAYLSQYCYPSSQGDTVMYEGEALASPPGQERACGHYQSSKLFYSRFKRLSPAMVREKSSSIQRQMVTEKRLRFTVGSLWSHPNELALSVDGCSTFETESGKLLTGFHLKVQHGNQTWVVAKTYQQFEALEENLRVVFPELPASLQLPKSVAWFRKETSSQTRKCQTENLDQFLLVLFSSPDIISSKLVYEFLQPPSVTTELDEITDSMEGGELILCAGHLDVHSTGLFHTQKTCFVVLTDSSLHFYAHKKQLPLSQSLRTPSMSLLTTPWRSTVSEEEVPEEDEESSATEELDDSIFVDEPEEDPSDASSEISSVSTPSLAPQAHFAVDYSLSRLRCALQSNQLSQLRIPLHVKRLEEMEFKRLESIPIRQIVEVWPADLSVAGEVGQSSVEVLHVDGGKKRSIYLSPSSKESFDYFPFNGTIIPNTILEHWLTALRQANNMKPIEVVIV